MNLESVNLESVAIGLYSLGVYLTITILCKNTLQHFGWTLFWTGVGKHISVIVLGLDDYLCPFYFKRVFGNLTETEKGKNPGGREFRESLEYTVVGALVEGCLFFLIGSGIYWLTRWKKGGVVFLTGILLFYLAKNMGLQKIFCTRSITLSKPMF